MSPAALKARPIPDAEESDGRGGVQALQRAMALLSAFTVDEPHLSLADLSRKTGLNKATMLRLLATLKEFGYIGQTPHGLYHVGAAALLLGRLYQSSVTERDVVQPLLMALVQRTNESASFAVREGDVRVCVYRVNSPNKIRDHVEIGDVLPLGRGAVGKVLLAFSSDDGTADLADVRRRCFSATRGEIEPDAAGVAVPVFRRDRVAGALALTGPATRLTPEALPMLRAVLTEAAISMTEQLGGDAGPLRRAMER